jgi:predicted transcriptional regulator
MLDRKKLRDHHLEVTYVLGRFLNEHLIRVFKAFDGDITAAIVLGTIGQYNYRRYYTEVGEKFEGGFHQLASSGEHLAHVRPINALSISDSTGIPRETVRRKIRMLIAKGWVKKSGRDKLVVTRLPAQHFADFDLETMEWFYAAAKDVLRLVERRGRAS